jgi:ABC-type branched-subunit amino acid transport system substrate-binding protein
MNRLSYRLAVFSVLLLTLCTSCAQRSRIGAAPLPKTSAAADQLFQQAEKNFQTSALPEALALYQDYVTRYPDHPLAAAALMRIGSIHTMQGDPVQARRSYERLISNYPSSSLRPEAALERLNCFVKEGRHQEVITQGAEALSLMSLPAQRSRTFSLIGDAHMALGSHLNAVAEYTRALKLGSPTEQEMIVPKLRSAILKLSAEEVQTLADRPDGDLPMDYLLFQSGMLLAREGRSQDGLVLLKAFQSRYPGHDYSERAERAIAEIQQAPSMEKRVLGCLLPLSGSYQAIGQRALRGVELAVNLHNSAVGEAPVRMLIKDSTSNAASTLQALQELNREQVLAVIGPLVHAETAAQEAQRLGIPIVTITQKESVVGIGDYVFRNFITPGGQVRAMVSYAVGKLGITRAAILYPNEAYGRTFMELFRSEFQANGGEILTAVAYSPEATDFSDPIKKLLRFSHEIPKVSRTDRAENRESRSRRSRLEEKDVELICDFQAIFIPDEPKKVGMVVPQLFYHDIKNVYLFGTNLWHSEALLTHAAPYVQGAIMADAFFADSLEPPVRRFVQAFQETYQETPGFIEAVLYDSAKILMDVVARAGVRFRSDVALSLRSPEGFLGATGLTHFAENGDADKVLHILEVRGKKFVELE